MLFARYNLLIHSSLPHLGLNDYVTANCCEPSLICLILLLIGFHPTHIVHLIEKCSPGWRSSRVQPRFDRLTCHWWAAFGIPCWKLRALHLRPKNLASEEKEACLQEEDEERTTEARHISSRRVDVIMGCNPIKHHMF